MGLFSDILSFIPIPGAGAVGGLVDGVIGGGGGGSSAPPSDLTQSDREYNWGHRNDGGFHPITAHAQAALPTSTRFDAAAGGTYGVDAGNSSGGLSVDKNLISGFTDIFSKLIGPGQATQGAALKAPGSSLMSESLPIAQNLSPVNNLSNPAQVFNSSGITPIILIGGMLVVGYLIIKRKK